MNLTAQKFYADERRRLSERRAAVEARIFDYHEKLTDAIRERALLDDLDMRLLRHLPETDYEIVDGEQSGAVSGSIVPKPARGPDE